MLIQAHEQERLMHKILSLTLCRVTMPRNCNLIVAIIRDLKFFTSEATEGIARVEYEPRVARP